MILTAESKAGLKHGLNALKGIFTAYRKRGEMEDLKKQVGQLIRDTRKAKGLTQKELGEKIGVTESTANRIENGNQNLTLETLERISAAFGVEIAVSFK